MRIEGDGIGATQALQSMLTAPREDEEPPIGPIDVEPQALLVRQVGQGGNVVDGAAVDGASAAHDEKGLVTVFLVGPDLVTQPVNGDLLICVGWDDADVVDREAGEHRSLGHRVMDLIGAIERSLEEVIGERLPPRSDDGDEVGPDEYLEYGV